MRPNKQYRVKVDTTFSENKSAGVGARYINSGEMTIRDAIEIACTCLFAPIGGAAAGESISKVKARQEISRTIFETYMSLALSRAEVSEGEDSTWAENKVLPTEIKLEDTRLTMEREENSSMESEKLQECSSSVTKIYFDDEEF